MPFDRPTLTTIFNRIQSDLQTRITGANTLLRRSVLSVLAKVHAGAIHLIYGYMDYEAKQFFILSADEYGLIKHGTEYGMDREAAVKATGTCAATGTAATTIPAETELESDEGQVYITDAAVTLDALGAGTLAFTASDAGVDANDDGGISLSFVSPISGVDATATVSANGISGGLDEEDIEDWRDRLLARKRSPPHGGAEHDYETWAKEVSGVTRAWSFPLYFGVGTVGLAFVRDEDTSIIPDATEMKAVYDYVISHEDPVTGKTVGIPVTAEPGFFIIGYNDGQTFVEKEVDLTLAIYPNNTTIQAAVTTKVQDALELYGGPGETVYLSDLYFMIGDAANLERLRIDLPGADIVATNTEVHVLGTITFDSY
jgi:uncharacterized phage protein gp47/JayE